MTYALLVKKILLEKKKILTKEELKSYADALKMSYESAIRYLTTNKYLLRILRGIFYVPSAEEKKLKTTEISYHEALAEALRIKKISKWYFGLESALKLNNMTHEHFTENQVITGTIHRNKPFKILGNSTKFIKLKKSLLNFGIITKNRINYSDPEKTLLDITYLAKYNNYTDNEIKNKIRNYFDKCSEKKLNKYLKHYPKSVRVIINDIQKPD